MAVDMYSKLLAQNGHNEAGREDDIHSLREKLFQKIWNADIDLQDKDTVRRYLRVLVAEEGLSSDYIELLMQEIYGYGPISGLMNDPDVTDIWIDRHDAVYYEKDGHVFKWHKTFGSESQLKRFAQRLAAMTGRKVDEARPVEDFRLPDGSRVVVFLDGVSVRGTSIVIRRFARLFTLKELADRLLFSHEFIRLFELLVKARINIFLAGGMGTGKNTLMYALMLCVGEDEKIVFVEDPAETKVGLFDPNRPDIPVPRVTVYEPRRAGVEGEGEVSIDLLFEKALRTKPTRVVCSECRNGATAFWTLQAMNIGHPGSMSSIHAEGVEEVPIRLSDMLASYEGGAFSSLASRAGKIAAAELVLFLGQINGHRRLLDIAEIRRKDNPNDLPEIHPLFTFNIDGFAEDGSPLGRMVSTGTVPCFLNSRKISLFLTAEEAKELRGFFK